MFNKETTDVFKIEAVFNKDYDYSSFDLTNVEEDDVIKTLDTFLIPIENESLISLKHNNLSYLFYKQASEGWPSEKVIVSRQKVLRLCNLLKQQGLWINENMSDEDKKLLIVSVLVKDSIVSMSQFRTIIEFVNQIIIRYNKNVGGVKK